MSDVLDYDLSLIDMPFSICVGFYRIIYLFHLAICWQNKNFTLKLLLVWNLSSTFINTSLIKRFMYRLHNIDLFQFSRSPQVAFPLVT